MDITFFPPLNACLNATTAFFLLLGLFFILKKNVRAHQFCMLIAFLVSTVFLGCYLYYHYHHGATPFTGKGWIRPVYFFILTSHTVLAILNLPLIFVTFYYALYGKFQKHRLIARWAWPIWMYISLTGVLVYFMLYKIFPV